jgi:hypothetical protein
MHFDTTNKIKQSMIALIRLNPQKLEKGLQRVANMRGQPSPMSNLPVTMESNLATMHL